MSGRVVPLWRVSGSNLEQRFALPGRTAPGQRSEGEIGRHFARAHGVHAPAPSGWQKLRVLLRRSPLDRQAGSPVHPRSAGERSRCHYQALVLPRSEFQRIVQHCSLFADFVVNEQETHRLTIDSLIRERPLRELYLRPFEIAIREANPWALMTSYNLINGVHADMHQHTLQTILRGEWGYDGCAGTFDYLLAD